MIIEIVENDTPRDVKTKLAEYLARPPQPVLRFYGKHNWEGSTFKFSVRNGMPIPLMYGVYIIAGGDYRGATDHIGPFSTDNWKLEVDNTNLANVVIQLGLIPFEIKTDKVEVRIG